MPIYDYICSNGHRNEVIHGVHAEGPTICPQCGGPLRRALSAPTIHFRGTGWAKKDRAATSAPARKAAGSDTAAGSGDKRDASSDSAAPAGTAEQAAGEEGSSAGKGEGSGKTESSGKHEGSGPDKSG